MSESAAPTEFEPLVDVYGAAAYLNRSKNSVYVDAREGRLPHYRIGGSIRFSLAELRAWVEAQRRGPKPPAEANGRTAK